MAVSVTFTAGVTTIPATWLNWVNTVVNGSIGTGTVTTVSVATANGFAGTVATATTTPAITLTTTVTGLLKGNGTAISAATAGTDYSTASAVETFTNKTYDTAGTGNSLSINGVAVTANTGTGAVARATSPTFVTPALGVATCTSLNSLTVTTSTGTFTLTNAKTLSVTNTLTFSGTDGTVMTFPTTSATLARTDAANTFTGHQTIEGVTSTGATGTGKFVFDTSPTLVTPVLGTPSSGTLSSCTVDGTNGVGYINIPQNSKSAAYTTVLADAGKHLYHPGADTTARTFTIDSNANVAYPIGTTLTFVNDTSAGVVTISITSDTMILAGSGSTGNRTLAANGMATALKMTATRWIISGTGLT